MDEKSVSGSKTPDSPTFNVTGTVMEHDKQLAVLDERTKHLATKADVQIAVNSLLLKIIAAATVLGGALVSATYWIARNVPTT